MYFPQHRAIYILRGAYMGYTIRYSPESNKRYPAQRKTKYIRRIVFFCLSVLTIVLAIKYRSVIGRILLPGDPDITADALQCLLSDIQEKSAGDAITAFCREIISGAAG